MRASIEKQAESLSDFLESLSFENVIIKFCERFDGQSRIWNFNKHSHAYFELIFFIEGRANVRAGPDLLDISLFDTLIYPPGVSHQEHLDSTFRQEIICIWADLGKCAPFNHAIKLQDSGGNIRQIFEMIYQEHALKRPLANELIAAYFRSLFLLIRQYFVDPPKLNDSRVELCLSYIHEHYTEPFGIEELSKMIFVSPSYLFRLFRKKTGITPIQYKNQVRIEKAKLLLIEHSDSIEEISGLVGFEDVKYFSRLFKKLTRCPPTEFRKRNIG